MVGSGTLITFPTLLAFGLPPVLANVSNTVGLTPGSFSGAWAGRPELVGQRSRVLRLGVGSFIGAVIGALLLLRLPAAAFDAIVPILIGLGCLLVIIGPRLSRWLADRRERLGASEVPDHGHPWLWFAILATGVYGGYFGAAQGVLLIAILGVGLADPLPRLNALQERPGRHRQRGRRCLVHRDLARSTGGRPGRSRSGRSSAPRSGRVVGRRLPPIVYRVVIVVVGVVAIVNLLVR